MTRELLEDANFVNKQAICQHIITRILARRWDEVWTPTQIKCYIKISNIICMLLLMLGLVPHPYLPCFEIYLT